jgi:hypothetical protein
MANAAGKTSRLQTQPGDMHPYRDTPMCADRRSHPGSEELILYGLLVVIGAIPVGLALLQQAAFGIDATLGVIMIGAGTLGAIAYATRARPRSAGPAEAPSTGASRHVA